MSKPSALNAFAMFCSALILFVYLLPSAGQNPDAEKNQAQYAGATGLINVYRQPKNIADPVQIIRITEGGNEIVQGVFRMPPYETPGQPIPASDDWIENLSISLKNLTSIKIEFMRVHFSFLYGEDPHHLGHVVGWDLDLGQIPAVTASTYYKKGKVPAGTGQPLDFSPGQEITIPLAGGLGDKIKPKIEAKTPFSSVTGCVIGIVSAYFDQPGLKWANFGMGWTLPDPNSPDGFKTQFGFFPGDLSHAIEDRVPPHNAQVSAPN